MTEAQGKEQTCVIVGASHAGSLLAVQLRKEGWAGKIILIGAEEFMPYHRPPLSKAVLAGEKEVEKILLRPALMYANNDVQLQLGAQVTKIDRTEKTVSLSNGETITILYGHIVR